MISIYSNGQQAHCFRNPHSCISLIAMMFITNRDILHTKILQRNIDIQDKHPTYIRFGFTKQFALCLVDSDDTLDSLFASDMAIGRYVF